MTHYVYSTITNDVTYNSYEGEGGHDVPRITNRVLIKGGANRANKRLITPYGVATEVTDEELEFLQKNDAFIRHQKKGFITVSSHKADADKVASEMTKKDDSAPLTPTDFSNAPNVAKVGDSAEESKNLLKKLFS